MGRGRAPAGAVRGGLERFALGWSRSGSSSAAAATFSPLDPIWVLLGSSPFRCESPRFWGLEKLGFPWILSSKSILINGLRGFLLKVFFLPLLSSRKSREMVSPRFRARKGRIAH
jgi:hypothetical protein